MKPEIRRIIKELNRLLRAIYPLRVSIIL